MVPNEGPFKSIHSLSRSVTQCSESKYSNKFNVLFIKGFIYVRKYLVHLMVQKNHDEWCSVCELPPTKGKDGLSPLVEAVYGITAAGHETVKPFIVASKKYPISRRLAIPFSLKTYVNRSYPIVQTSIRELVLSNTYQFLCLTVYGPSAA